MGTGEIGATSGRGAGGPAKGIRSVCFVAPFAYPVLSNRDAGPTGGAEVQQVLCGRALRSAGLAVSFVVGTCGQAPREEHHGLAVYACPFRYLGGPRSRLLPDTVRLGRLLAGIRADLHLMISPRSLLLPLALYRRFLGGRLVKIVGSTPDVRDMGRGPSSLAYRAGVGALDATVFQTEAQAREGAANLGLRGPVIPTFIPEAPAVTKAGERDIDVLWVGGCDANKRPGLLLDLARALPRHRFTMICGPRGDSGLYESIRSLARTLPNVEHLASVQSPDPTVPYWAQLAGHFARARVLVSTSREEGFPNVFLEAWQAGVPVVTLSADPDGVVRREGLGCRSETMPRLVEDVRGLLEAEDRRSATGEVCRRHVRQVHGTETLVNAYLELFRGLADRAAPGQ
ncbi:MAG: glycosyltransferase family 4 protein [Deltaproteobacteria bacterium]|nr:glycosyltransferase family 4 protein [Deltaproteobacteria bacterium]